VVVVESDAGVCIKDFEDRQSAEQYASDAASESDYPPPLVYLFGDRLQFLGRGRHYAVR
jgi:hypothetical protein